jgi:hypothetical protein
MTDIQPKPIRPTPGQRMTERYWIALMKGEWGGTAPKITTARASQLRSLVRSWKAPDPFADIFTRR